MPTNIVRPYSQERGKCWLTPDGQFYYGDCLDKKTHVEIPAQPSADHTNFDPKTKTWFMSYMKEQDGAWVEDAELRTEYDAKVQGDAEAPIMEALKGIDAESIRPARELLKALVDQESAIMNATNLDELKEAISRVISRVDAYKVNNLEAAAEAERINLTILRQATQKIE